MDDTLELPTASSAPERAQDIEEELSSEDEDQGPDWTKIPGISVARPVIPKRGEKDFEPNAQGGSGLQRHVLDRSRSAMIAALNATRTISYKSVSHAVWEPELQRAYATVARGIHFTTMGHSVARTTNADEASKVLKRLELLPEEALYLVERGAMYCWKPTALPLLKTALLDDMEGVPMSVQQAYVEMIGTEDLTLEKYQVYAYLKRLGYVVTRTKPPSPQYPIPSPYTHIAQHRKSVLGRLYNVMATFFSRLSRIFATGRDWWRPNLHSRWLHHNMDSTSLFRSLRFLPTGPDHPLHIQPKQNATPSPYHIFFNLYKPSTPFKKTSPPPADFSVVVVNARTTPMPTLSELTALFDELPELPPPVPRKRISFAQQKIAATQEQTAPKTDPATPGQQSTSSSRVLAWIWPSSSNTSVPPRPNNPFPSLKTGKKMVVIAVVDAGTISFFRFGQGVFTEWPMS